MSKALDKLFEALDDKVFTPELKESLKAQFNEAVEAKAIEIADEKIEEEITKLSEKADEHIELLNEKAETYKEEQKVEMLESLDKYLDRVVEEFVEEVKDTLAESVVSEKAEMIVEAMDAMLVATGVKIATIVEAKDENSVQAELEESTAKVDTLVEENVELKAENENLVKLGTISELKEGLSLVEAEKFEKLAELVEFSKDETFVAKLETIKESVLGSVEVKTKDDDLNETAKPKSSYAHLV